MAFELASEPAALGSAGSPDSVSSSSDIDRLLSEILNDPNVFSLLDSPSSSSSSAPSPPCYSPSPQQLEQEALASLGQQPPYRLSTEYEADRLVSDPCLHGEGVPAKERAKPRDAGTVGSTIFAAGDRSKQ